MKLHFISGLPRAGSTMLAAVLRQNPRFHGSIASPVAVIFRAFEDGLARHHETNAFLTAQKRMRMMRGLFEMYYEGIDRDVILDTSRLWCARLPLIATLFPEARILVCVREVGWILDSFERLYRKNGMTPSAIYDWDNNGTVFTRSMMLGRPGGAVGFALNAVQEAVAGAERSRLMLIDYERFCRQPADQIAAVYDFLKEPRFRHDLDHVEYEGGEFDRQLGVEGLHRVTGKIEWRPRETVLPQRLFDELNGPNFWRQNST